MDLVIRSRAIHRSSPHSFLALTFRPRTMLLSLLLFLSIFLILASTRAGTGLNSLFAHINIRPSFPFIKSTPTSFPHRPITNSTMAPAQYKSPPQPPPLFTATKDSLVDDAKKLCTKTRSMPDELAKDIRPDKATFENVLLPMAQDEDAAALKSRIIGFYQAVSTDSELRDAGSKAEEMMDEFNIEASMREDIFALVQAAWDKSQKSESGLDGESLRLLEKERKSYIQNGLGIKKGPKRDRFKKIKKRLSQLSIEFQKNLNEENGGIWFTKKELEGVPEDVLGRLESGTGENEGKLQLSFKYPDLFPTLKFALDTETRQKVFIQNENKLNQNVPLFREAIILRDEAARLLGYPYHASFRIEDKMAKTPKTVTDFLSDLKEQLTPGGAKEVAHLMELKSKDLKTKGLAHTNNGNYYLWDNRFYNRLMVEKEFSIDEQKIAEYFPLQSTIEGMLAIFQELMGFVFVEIGPEDRAKISHLMKS